MVIVVAWFGVIAVLLAFMPVVAISPILLYIGMLMGAHAFQTTPSRHACAIVPALTPHRAARCKTPDRPSWWPWLALACSFHAFLSQSAVRGADSVFRKGAHV